MKKNNLNRSKDLPASLRENLKKRKKFLNERQENEETPFFEHHESHLTLRVRLTPNAKQTGIIGIFHNYDNKVYLKVSVALPPEDGKANKALIEFLADNCGVAKSSIELISGDTSRLKVLRLPLSAKLPHEWLASLDDLEKNNSE